METRKDVHPVLQKAKKFINLKDIPPELHLAVKLKAVERGQSIQDFILDTLAKAVKK